MKHMDRRRFIGGLGAAALAVPFLGLWRRNRAVAAEGMGACRLIVFFSPNGTVNRHWRPTGDTTDFSFPSGSILEPLTALRSELVVLDGLDFKGASNHEGGMAAMLTGGGGTATATRGASVDQYVASLLGQRYRFPSLELGVQTSAWGGNVQTRMSYRAAGDMVPPDDDPRSVFRRVFAGLAPMPQGTDGLLARRRSVLDLVRAELRELGRAVGTEEGRKLEAHLEALRRVELGLSAAPPDEGPPRACAPTEPRLSGPTGDNARFPEVGRAQLDLLVTAASCGVAPVLTIQFAHTVAPHVFSWLNLSEGHHGLSHMDDGNAEGVASFVRAERWFAEQFAYLLNQLRALPEPGAEGTLLDHSLVVWAKEMGDSRLHVCTSVPFVLAGRASGRVRPGRYLRFAGEPHTKLLVSICHAMGLSNPTFGDPSHGAGPLAGVVS